MSDQKSNIDKLFQDHLKGHEIQAPKNAWARLQHDLHKPARTGFFWYSRAAAAVILLMLAFGAGYFMSEFNRTGEDQLAENPVITDVQKQEIPESVPFNEDATPENVTATKNTAIAPSSEAKITEAGNQVVTKAENTLPSSEEIQEDAVAILDDQDGDTAPAEERTVPEPEVEIPANDLTVAQNTEESRHEDNAGETIISTEDEVPVMDDEMLHHLLVGDDQDFAMDMEGLKTEDAFSRWTIGGRISPVYSYRSIEGNSFITPDETVDVDFFNSNEDGIVTIAGGISLDYNFSDRVSLGSGMYISRIGQQNNDVLAYNDPGSNNMYKLATSTGTVTVNPVKFDRVIAEQTASAKDSMPGDYTVNGSFVQNLDYLEIPFVLKYKVLDRKFSVNVLGGLSPGILVNNRSYFDVEGQKLQTGTTENINPFIYNSVLGLGLEYAISGKFSVSMEPSFKYSLTPVNSNNGLDYHPYSLSWFTGISYKLY